MENYGWEISVIKYKIASITYKKKQKCQEADLSNI